jgi:hypothetical protein
MAAVTDVTDLTIDSDDESAGVLEADEAKFVNDKQKEQISNALQVNNRMLGEMQLGVTEIGAKSKKGKDTSKSLHVSVNSSCHCNSIPMSRMSHGRPCMLHDCSVCSWSGHAAQKFVFVYSR